MTHGGRWACAMATALTALPMVLVGQAPARGSARAVPSHVLILGVPFISWSEAANLHYWEKDAVNPSLPASEGMILKYWGRDLAVLRDSAATVPGWVHQGGDGGSLDSLKSFVARGIPVVVCLALTPIADNVPPMAAMLAVTDSGMGETLERANRSSGILGPMIALDTLRRWGEKLIPEGGMQESVLMACRVVIGYDDARTVVTLHDPSFGAAWEVSYQDFEAMWSAWKRFYAIMYPPSFAALLAKRPAAPPYPARTPSQRAAEAFVYGYALASVGRRKEAEVRLADGLAIPGLPIGYRHLMLLEVARLAEARQDTAAAVANYRAAGALLPQDHRPWLFLGRLMQHDGPTGSRAVADSLLSRAAALCADSVAQETTWRALPHDVMLSQRSGCEPPTAPPPAAELAAGEIGFELPGPGWKRREGEGLQIVRVEVPGSRTQAISVWPADVPEGLRGLPPERQTSEYFEMERRSPRDVPWSGFVEGTREIAHRRYPTLSAQISLQPDAAPPVTGDVLLLLVFPHDFTTRQRFYVVMWQDYHPASERGAGPKALDAFISSLRAAP
jgi:hypothetical protein